MKQISSILWVLPACGSLVISACVCAGAQGLPPHGGSKGMPAPAAKEKASGVAAPAGKKAASDSKTLGKSAGTGSEKAASQTAPRKAAGVQNLEKGKSKDLVFVNAGAGVSAASAGSRAKTGNRVKNNVPGPESRAAGPVHANKKASTGTGRLVPPPPPSIPTASEMGVLGNGTTMIFVGENIDYMSAQDLHDLKERTDRGIERYRKQVEELIASAAEKEQRSSLFVGLYNEGVISRRELEASKRESVTANLELADAKQNLDALEKRYVKIEQRLETLAKTKKPGNASVSARVKRN